MPTPRESELGGGAMQSASDTNSATDSDTGHGLSDTDSSATGHGLSDTDSSDTGHGLSDTDLSDTGHGLSDTDSSATGHGLSGTNHSDTDSSATGHDLSDTEQDSSDLEHDSGSGRGGAFASLGYRNFRYFWIGGFISGAGRFFQVVTLPSVIWDLTRSPGWVGFIGFTQFLPMAVMTPIGGPLADRYPRRKMLLVTQSLLSVTALMLALMWWAEIRSPYAYAALSVLSGLFGGLSLPGWQAFVSELVPRHLMLNAVTLNSAQFNSSRLIGPVLAGITVATAGPGVAFSVNAVTYLAVISALLVIDAPGTVATDMSPLRPISNLLATARYVRERPGIDTAIALVALIGCFGLSVQLLTVVLASDVFRRGASGYGLMLSMLGLGAVAATPFVASLGGRVSRSKLQGFALLVYGGALLGLALAPTFELSLVPLAVMGAAHLTTASTLNTTVQLQVDDDRRAQVIGLYLMVLMLASPIGQLSLGQLMGLIGVRFTFALAGSVVLGCALWLAIRGGLSRLDAELGTYHPQVMSEVHPTTPSPPHRKRPT